jgi:hypothetical protein
MKRLRAHPTIGEPAIEADRRTLRRDHDPDCTEIRFPGNARCMRNVRPNLANFKATHWDGAFSRRSTRRHDFDAFWLLETAPQ